MSPTGRASPKPLVILVLGTDASGKDYVAELLRAHLAERGLILEKRRGWFSAQPCDRPSSEDKHPFRLILERLFLFFYPVLRWALHPGLAWAIHLDRLVFRFARRAEVLMVSHTPLRLLAFDLGHGRGCWAPRSVARALAALRASVDLRTLVLDTDTEIRARRIRERAAQSRADHFDHYMAAHPDRSEKVAQALISLARTHLDATVLHNNASGPDDLLASLKTLWPDLRGETRAS